MGDLSSEPSMEEILCSIKRIIAEEGDTTPGRPRRPMRGAPAATPAPREERDEVLELRDPISSPEPVAVAAAGPAPEPAVAASPSPSLMPEVASTTPEPIVSQHAAEATRDALGHLSRLLIKPEPNTDGTLEGLVREMLRPVLREWLDANLPGIVEQMVAREIAKITAGVR